MLTVQLAYCSTTPPSRSIPPIPVIPPQTLTAIAGHRRFPKAPPKLSALRCSPTMVLPAPIPTVGASFPGRGASVHPVSKVTADQQRTDRHLTGVAEVIRAALQVSGRSVSRDTAEQLWRGWNRVVAEVVSPAFPSRADVRHLAACCASPPCAPTRCPLLSRRVRPVKHTARRRLAMHEVTAKPLACLVLDVPPLRVLRSSAGEEVVTVLPVITSAAASVESVGACTRGLVAGICSPASRCREDLDSIGPAAVFPAISNIRYSFTSVGGNPCTLKSL